MPTYEYACSACKHQWEATQRITEPPVALCPVCDKSTAYRLISAGTNFILKGGGWYSDLYASPKPASESSEKKNETTEAKSDNAGTNGTTTKSGTAGDATSKPAAPTAASAKSEPSAASSSGSSGTPSGKTSVPST
ncbi:MAG: zinc ribbon domain-containing protein [Myxococcota bacterium]|nr:zinc ribbon domain-containing protein [Myxococcota bacterium]